MEIDNLKIIYIKRTFYSPKALKHFDCLKTVVNYISSHFHLRHTFFFLNFFVLYMYSQQTIEKKLVANSVKRSPKCWKFLKKNNNVSCWFVSNTHWFRSLAHTFEGCKYTPFSSALKTILHVHYSSLEGIYRGVSVRSGAMRRRDVKLNLVCMLLE